MCKTVKQQAIGNDLGGGAQGEGGEEEDVGEVEGEGGQRGGGAVGLHPGGLVRGVHRGAGVRRALVLLQKVVGTYTLDKSGSTVAVLFTAAVSAMS